MKKSALVVIAVLLSLGVITIVAAKLVQLPTEETIQVDERHDVDLGYVSPWTYNIDPGNAPWLTYDLKEGTIVKASLVISGGSGDDINFYIKDSEGNTVFDVGRVSKTYSYQFVAPKDDYYRVYMDNSFSWFSSKTVHYTVEEAYYMETVDQQVTNYYSLEQTYPWVLWVGAGFVLCAIAVGVVFALQSP